MENMKRVLVFDDDTIISEVVAIILFDSKLGEVFTFPNCDDIIGRIESVKPSVILMDHNIPREGGIVATRTIKSHPEHKDIPVIYFSASEDIITLAQTAGADYVLAKPFKTSEVEQMIKETISRDSVSKI
jgi:two-component system cell cycle response regulator DivK